MNNKWDHFKVGDRVYCELSSYGTVTYMDKPSDDFCVKYDNEPHEVEEDMEYVVKVINLIWEYYQTDGYTYGFTHAIPFEYTSKEDFCFHVLEKIEKLKKEDKDARWMPLLGIGAVEISELEYIEHQVLTLEEWLNKEKPKTIF